jgi:hypothetical protein
MKLTYLVLLGALVLVSGSAFDIATTAIALLHPAFAGSFVEAANPFLRLFMYDLGLAPAIGFIFGILITLTFEVTLIYVTYSRSASYTPSWITISLLSIFLLGIGHWLAGYNNLMLLRLYAPFGF